MDFNDLFAPYSRLRGSSSIGGVSGSYLGEKSASLSASTSTSYASRVKGKNNNDFSRFDDPNYFKTLISLDDTFSSAMPTAANTGNEAFNYGLGGRFRGSSAPRPNFQYPESESPWANNTVNETTFSSTSGTEMEPDLNTARVYEKRAASTTGADGGEYGKAYHRSPRSHSDHHRDDYMGRGGSSAPGLSESRDRSDDGTNSAPRWAGTNHFASPPPLDPRSGQQSRKSFPRASSARAETSHSQHVRFVFEDSPELNASGQAKSQTRENDVAATSATDQTHVVNGEKLTPPPIHPNTRVEVSEKSYGGTPPPFRNAEEIHTEKKSRSHRSSASVTSSPQPNRQRYGGRSIERDVQSRYGIPNEEARRSTGVATRVQIDPFSEKFADDIANASRLFGSEPTKPIAKVHNFVSPTRNSLLRPPTSATKSLPTEVSFDTNSATTAAHNSCPPSTNLPSPDAEVEKVISRVNELLMALRGAPSVSTAPQGKSNQASNTVISLCDLIATDKTIKRCEELLTARGVGTKQIETLPLQHENMQSIVDEVNGYRNEANGRIKRVDTLSFEEPTVGQSDVARPIDLDDSVDSNSEALSSESEEDSEFSDGENENSHLFRDQKDVKEDVKVGVEMFTPRRDLLGSRGGRTAKSNESESSSWWALLQPVSRELSRFVLMKSTAAATPLPSLSPRPKERKRDLSDDLIHMAKKGTKNAARDPTSRRVDLFSITDDDDDGEGKGEGSADRRALERETVSFHSSLEKDSQRNDEDLNTISNNFDSISQRLSGIDTSADLTQVTRALFKVSSLISTGTVEQWSATSEVLTAAKSHLSEIQNKIRDLENARAKLSQSKCLRETENNADGAEEEKRESAERKRYEVKIRFAADTADCLQRKVKFQSGLRENFEAIAMVERVIVENAQKLSFLLGQRNKMVKDFLATEIEKRHELLPEKHTSACSRSPSVNSFSEDRNGDTAGYSSQKSTSSRAAERMRAQRELDKAIKQEIMEESRSARRNLRKAKANAEHAEEDFQIALSIKQNVYEPLVRFIKRQNNYYSSCSQQEDYGNTYLISGHRSVGFGKQVLPSTNAENKSVLPSQRDQSQNLSKSVHGSITTTTETNEMSKVPLDRSRKEKPFISTASISSAFNQTGGDLSSERSRKAFRLPSSPRLFVPVGSPHHRQSSSSSSSPKKSAPWNGLRSSSVLGELSLMERTMGPLNTGAETETVGVASNAYPFQQSTVNVHTARGGGHDLRKGDKEQDTDTANSDALGREGEHDLGANNNIFSSVRTTAAGASGLFDVLKQWDTSNPRKSLNFD